MVEQIGAHARMALKEGRELVIEMIEDVGSNKCEWVIESNGAVITGKSGLDRDVVGNAVIDSPVAPPLLVGSLGGKGVTPSPIVSGRAMR